jgi:hypothetical protein
MLCDRIYASVKTYRGYSQTEHRPVIERLVMLMPENYEKVPLARSSAVKSGQSSRLQLGVSSDA